MLGMYVFKCTHRRWLGTVGPPLPCTAFRLEAVPEMKYDPCASHSSCSSACRNDTLALVKLR